MEKTKKYVLIAITAVICFSSLFLVNYFFTEVIEDSAGSDDVSSDDEPKSSVKNITLIVDYAGAKPKKTESDFSLTNYKTTVFDAVDKWCDVTHEVYPNGDYYITHIDGVGVGWVYKINNDPNLPDEPVNEYYLSDEDTIEFTYVGI